jgi:hypothetical protein
LYHDRRGRFEKLLKLGERGLERLCGLEKALLLRHELE